jgi:hypothetical protein
MLDAELRPECSDYPIFRGKTTDTHDLEIVAQGFAWLMQMC